MAIDWSKYNFHPSVYYGPNGPPPGAKVPTITIGDPPKKKDIPSPPLENRIPTWRGDPIAGAGSFGAIRGFLEKNALSGGGYYDKFAKNVTNTLKSAGTQLGAVQAPSSVNPVGSPYGQTGLGGTEENLTGTEGEPFDERYYDHPNETDPYVKLAKMGQTAVKGLTEASKEEYKGPKSFGEMFDQSGKFKDDPSVQHYFAGRNLNAQGNQLASDFQGGQGGWENQLGNKWDAALGNQWKKYNEQGDRHGTSDAISAQKDVLGKTVTKVSDAISGAPVAFEASRKRFQAILDKVNGVTVKLAKADTKKTNGAGTDGAGTTASLDDFTGEGGTFNEDKTEWTDSQGEVWFKGTDADGRPAWEKRPKKDPETEWHWNPETGQWERKTGENSTEYKPGTADEMQTKPTQGTSTTTEIPIWERAGKFFEEGSGGPKYTTTLTSTPGQVLGVAPLSKTVPITASPEPPTSRTAKWVYPEDGSKPYKIWVDQNGNEILS